jgi:allantoin racemase
MRIGFINPAPYKQEHALYEKLLKKTIDGIRRADTIVDILWPEQGYSDPDSAFPRAYDIVQIAKTAYRAERDGCDAAVIGCFLDPGLREARSILSIPVSGACESAVNLASVLGCRFLVITIEPQTMPSLADYIESLSPRPHDFVRWDLTIAGAVDLYKDPELFIRTFSDFATRTIQDNNADVIIPNCTLISTILTAHNVHQIKGVPIIDPVITAVQRAEELVDLQQKYGLGVCRATIYNPGTDIIKEMAIV